jgi:hypothetical protein
MQDIFQRPYEISLWDDDLFWRKQLLKKVKLTKETYKPGKYYSNNFNESATSG